MASRKSRTRPFRFCTASGEPPCRSWRTSRSGSCSRRPPAQPGRELLRFAAVAAGRPGALHAGERGHGLAGDAGGDRGPGHPEEGRRCRRPTRPGDPVVDPGVHHRQPAGRLAADPQRPPAIARPAGYTPIQIQTAYGLSSTGGYNNDISFAGIKGDGAGQTIGIYEEGYNPAFVDTSDPGYSAAPWRSSTRPSACPTRPA